MCAVVSSNCPLGKTSTDGTLALQVRYMSLSDWTGRHWLLQCNNYMVSMVHTIVHDSTACSSLSPHPHHPNPPSSPCRASWWTAPCLTAATTGLSPLSSNWVLAASSRAVSRRQHHAQQLACLVCSLLVPGAVCWRSDHLTVCRVSCCVRRGPGAAGHVVSSQLARTRLPQARLPQHHLCVVGTSSLASQPRTPARCAAVSVRSASSRSPHTWATGMQVLDPRFLAARP